jgi:hypothetical protein
MKIISVLFGIIIWFAVLDNVNPYRTKTLSVPITVENEAVLQNNNIIVKKEYTHYVAVNIRGREAKINNAVPSDFLVKMDFSKIKSLSDSTIKLDGPYYVGKDGLSDDPGIDGSYDLTSYSWSILAGVADEKQIGTMLDVVEKYLSTDAGLKLCTPIRYEALGVNTPTALYFPGDRENGGVFKHAAMMAVVASLKAAKTVKDISLAKRLACLAYDMMEKTLPYRTLKTPYETKGNPRFCTQYNNSETGENIGPELSGTATWLTLAVFEMFGFAQKDGMLSFSPILCSGERTSYKLNLDQDGTAITVEAEGRGGAFRVSDKTEFMLDGKHCTGTIPVPRDKKEHFMKIAL